MTQYFNEVIGYNEAKKLKPEPDGLLKILEMEKIPAKRAIFIGDMTSDVICGRRAKVLSYIVFGSPVFIAAALLASSFLVKKVSYELLVIAGIITFVNVLLSFLPKNNLGQRRSKFEKKLSFT